MCSGSGSKFGDISCLSMWAINRVRCLVISRREISTREERLIWAYTPLSFRPTVVRGLDDVSVKHPFPLDRKKVVCLATQIS